MKEFILQLVTIMVFTAVFLAYPFNVLRKRHALKLYCPKLVLYFCTEISFAADLWQTYKEDLHARDQVTIHLPLRATFNGIFMYPLSRAILFIAISALFCGAVIYFSITFQLLHLRHIYNQLPLPFLLSICCAPFIMFYITSFSADSYALMKNQIIVKKFLCELGWDSYPQSKLEQIYKEVYVDFLLYKKNNDLGTIILLLGSGGILIYSRIAKLMASEYIILIISLFIVIVVAKTYYDGFRTRVIYIATITLLDLIEENRAKEVNPEILPSLNETDSVADSANKLSNCLTSFGSP